MRKTLELESEEEMKEEEEDSMVGTFEKKFVSRDLPRVSWRTRKAPAASPP